MKYILIILIGLILLFSCRVPYNKKDVFEEKADLSKDEAPHEKNSLEWWYFTGHLRDTLQDKLFGVEYVVFHLNPTNIRGRWMVNVAISDPENQKFYYDHKFFAKSKDQFAALPLDFVWNKKRFSSTMKGEKGNYEFTAGFGKEPIQLKLSTKPKKEVVLHDGTGYEDYGDIAKAGYYSFPRLATEGEIQLEDKTYSSKWRLVVRQTMEL
ncbi:MAG: carotenoid 1,2-hydratase [Flavobacteriales bacterium]|nr:carotenoid 1,2-hydratase [Flavobacteriales bacterium]